MNTLKLSPPRLLPSTSTTSSVVCCDTEVAGDAEDVSVALERLAARQKHRQYNATSVSSNLLSSASVTQCSTTLNGDSQPCKPKRVQSAHVWSQRTSATAGRHKDIDQAELIDCEEDTDPKHDPKRIHGLQHRLRQSSTARRREVTEDCEDLENRKRVHRRSHHSSAANHHGADQNNVVDGLASDTAGVNYYENQRSMIEQSRALLEQSKAKHHALVAQAHSMQKQFRSHQLTELPKEQHVLSDSQAFLAPKPPSAPPTDKKPTSMFRTQRLARYDSCYQN